jgi:hypothetical protein
MRNYLPTYVIIVIFTTAVLYGCSVPSYECDECGQVFDTEEELVEHKNLVHGEDSDEGAGDETGPVCDICGEEFGSFDEFVAHMEEEHPEEWRAIKEGQE